MFAMSSHNGHCAPAEHECVGRFFRPHRPIWNFFAQSSGPICAPIFLKVGPYGPQVLDVVIQKQNKKGRVLPHQVDKIYFKKI